MYYRIENCQFPGIGEYDTGKAAAVDYAVADNIAVYFFVEAFVYCAVGVHQCLCLGIAVENVVSEHAQNPADH